MALSEITRLQYLDAMNVNVWQPRFMPPITASEINTIDVSLVTTNVFNEIEIPDSWETLRAEVSDCKLCTLCTSRTQTVFGDGNINADWLFIGEAPGENEDLQGKPFVGEAGKLLTQMIRAMKLTREEVFITNILKCRPPHNRDPHIDEIKRCRDYLQRQITLVKPKIIVAVGRIAAQTLLGTNETIGKLRSKVHHIENTPLIAIYHPSYLLRSPIEKRKAWQDLQFAMLTFKSTH